MTTNSTPYQWIRPGEGPLDLYQAHISRAIDTDAAGFYKISSFELMQRAGRAAFQCLCTHWSNIDSVSVLCGTGNNGGDGFVVATLATQVFEHVQVVLVGSHNQVQDDAQQALHLLESTPTQIDYFAANDHRLLDQIKNTQTHLWVDALFGSGLNRTLNQDYVNIITQVNQHAAPSFSLDLPSGIHPDTGAVLGNAINAEATLSFITLKPGQFRDAGKHHCGQLGLAQLHVENNLISNHPSRVTRMHFEPRCYPSTRTDAHKGSQGTLVCIGGNHGMGGAILLTAQAALHMGVGKVYVATRAEHQTTILTHQPELMWLDPNEKDQMKRVLDKASAIVIGPGLGQDSWAQSLLNQIQALTLPIIADADALNLLAQKMEYARLKANALVITPHLGEAKRLRDRFCPDLDFEPFQVAQALADQLNAITVLKGAGTLVSEPNRPNQFMCDAGNPGMAKAGMGDVLAGAIAGLVAQSKFTVLEAVKLGVWIHSSAADQIATQDGIYNLLPSKLPEAMGRLVNTICQSTACQKSTA